MQSEAESDFISQRQAHCIHRSSDFTQVPLLAQGWSLLTLYCFINIASKETAKSSSVFLLKVSVVALYVRNICLLLGRNLWDYNETNFICVWKRQDNFFYPIVACSVVIAAEFSWFIIDTKHNTNEKSIKWEQEAFFFLCSHFFFFTHNFRYDAVPFLVPPFHHSQIFMPPYWHFDLSFLFLAWSCIHLCCALFLFFLWVARTDLQVLL